jgi:DNA-binding transcriptional LysR family regulator
MRFKGLDLNLLVLFEALMETRNVTRAAERLGLTQPAASAGLRRLRDFFQDDILIAVGKRMHPTPFAEMVLPQIQASLQGVERAIATPAAFDPATSARTFRIVTSDYIMVAVLVPLAERLARIAPNVRIEIRQPNEEGAHDLERGKIDLLITPEPYLAPWHPSELLFEESQVVVGWAQNPVFARGLTEAEFLAAGHVTVKFGTSRVPAFADSRLEQMGKARRVEIEVASFASAPWFLLHSTRLAVLHERLTRAMMPQFDLAYAPMPFAFPRMREMVQYHQARTQDASLRWFLDALKDVAVREVEA